MAFTATSTTDWVFRITEMPGTEPTPTLMPDPWQCVTENITQYFHVPKPSGVLLDALVSYGDKLLEPCLATATGLDVLSCAVSQSSEWCGFTTAAPATVLADYISYGSAAASFWRSNSETISIVASQCPVTWAKYRFTGQASLNQTIAQAECYNMAHPGNTTASSSSPSRTSTSRT